MQYNKLDRYSPLTQRLPTAQNTHHRQLRGRQIMHAHALCRKQLHHCLLQHHRRRFRTSPFTQKMKNVEVDGKKLRLQIVRVSVCSGTPQDRTASGRSHPPTTSIPHQTQRSTRHHRGVRRDRSRVLRRTALLAAGNRQVPFSSLRYASEGVDRLIVGNKSDQL